MHRDAPFVAEQQRQARQSLQRRGIDPAQALREGRRRGFGRLFARYVREERPSRRFRRIVRALLLAGYGRYPLVYLRALEVSEALGQVSRAWQRKFAARFFRFWAWAARIEPLPPVEELEAAVHALRSFQRLR